MRMELSIKRKKGRGRGRQKSKTSPPRRKGRERLKMRLPLTDIFVEGNTGKQSSPHSQAEGGEDTTPKGVKYSPSVARRLRG